ncbi:uncharacterized protein LOC130756378 [Actinidia eriantha]|uniref:uncharacterized protein LOC130756378 n=1 Tax=Actinidia eriantha TaxID=165200 RepID=UPI00258EBD3A|nr:uncharacterized protein LOC130756378 [Actinidia eriantha]
MRTLAYDDDCLPTVSYEAQNQRCRGKRRRASSCCGVPISPYLRIDGIRRKSFSYDKLPPHPLKLSICKLDGSSFDVEIVRTATVGELKQAVEGVFSHMPKKGPGKISWSHVWGHFCLCYDGWNLVVDSEPISSYGIIDGDQLHFVRHVSINYNLTRRWSKDRLLALQQPRMSELEQNGQNDGNSDDLESSLRRHCEDRHEDIVSHYELKLAQLLGRWFTYRRLGSSPGRKSESGSFSSRLADGFLGSFRSIIRLCSSNKLNSQRDPLDGSSDWHARH